MSHYFLPKSDAKVLLSTMKMMIVATSVLSAALFLIRHDPELYSRVTDDHLDHDIHNVGTGGCDSGRDANTDEQRLAVCG